MNDTKIASKAKAQLASFMGDDETLEASVSEAVPKDGARSVRSDTLLLVDPTEIRKEFSYKMEFVTRVKDASRSSKDGRDVLVNGYHGCMVADCRCGGRKTVPLVTLLPVYAIADGTRRAFTRFGKWVRTAAETLAKAPEPAAIQLLPGFAELLGADDG